MYKFIWIRSQIPKIWLDVNNEKHCIASQSQEILSLFKKIELLKIGCEETYKSCKINRSVLWETRGLTCAVSFPAEQSDWCRQELLQMGSRKCQRQWRVWGVVASCRLWMEKSGGRHRPPFLAKWRRKEKQILLVLTFHTHFKYLPCLKNILSCQSNNN